MKKTTILFSFEHTTLKDLRKLLFQRGLSPQEFFTYIADRLSLGDKRMETFLQEATDVKLKKLQEGGIEKKHINADVLYKAIEDSFKKAK